MLQETGIAWTDLRRRLARLKHDDSAWRAGRLPVYVYHHTEELLRISQQAYLEFFTENALGQGKAFPSVARLEHDVVGMGCELFGGSARSGGTFTSGGTESIFLAVKAARDWARAERAIAEPRLVVPRSAHATINKAAGYLGVEVVRTSLAGDLRADVGALEAAIDERTCMIVGSAPGYPHGVFDPIEQLAAIARRRGIWFHVDACVGGFLAPFVRELGHPVPPFDLSVAGVTTLSADIHKYGFAAKGSSLLLFADRDLQRYQRFEFSDWPRGTYATETFQGTRAAGPLASSWAVMNTLGRAGYREIAQTIIDGKERLIRGLAGIDGLAVIEPHDLSIVLLRSTDPALDIWAVADRMVERGWFVGRSVTPEAIHLALNPVVVAALEEYLDDLASCAAVVRATGETGTLDVHTY